MNEGRETPRPRALVTGGAVRVGRALSLRCARMGMDVAVHYRSSPESAARTVADCLAHGGSAFAVRGDLSNADAPTRVVDEAVEALGGLDVLVLSASTWEPRAFEQIDVEHIDRTLAVNVRAPLLMARAAADHLRASGRGRIVVMADLAGMEPWPRFLVHSMSKAAVEMMTRSLAQELAPAVTVNAIAPGTVLMPDDSSEAAAERSAQKAVLGRVGSPDDIADALEYLVGAGYVTGHTLVVDGGRLVRP